MNSPRLAYFEKEDVLHVLISEGPESNSVELSPNITAELNDERELIDRIVIEVLERLSTSARTVRPDYPNPHGSEATLNDAVVTDDVLAERVNGATKILIGAKSVITPSA